MTLTVTATVPGGVLQGHTTGDVTAFLGVPYAAAPFGANRMRPPQPVAPWTGIRSATDSGRPCPKATIRRSISGCSPRSSSAGTSA